MLVGSYLVKISAEGHFQRKRIRNLGWKCAIII